MPPCFVCSPFTSHFSLWQHSSDFRHQENKIVILSHGIMQAQVICLQSFYSPTLFLCKTLIAIGQTSNRLPPFFRRLDVSSFLFLKEKSPFLKEIKPTYLNMQTDLLTIMLISFSACLLHLFAYSFPIQNSQHTARVLRYSVHSLAWRDWL